MVALMPFDEFLARIDDAGGKYAKAARAKLRREFVAVKNSSKFIDWTEGNDTAFVLIDEMVKQLTIDAGFGLASRAPAQSVTLHTAAPEIFENEAMRRGFSLIPRQAQPAPVAPLELDPEAHPPGGVEYDDQKGERVNSEPSKTRPKVDTASLARAIGLKD